MYRPPKRTCEKNSKWLLFFASGSPSLAFSLRLSCFNQHVLTTAIRAEAAEQPFCSPEHHLPSSPPAAFAGTTLAVWCLPFNLCCCPSSLLLHRRRCNQCHSPAFVTPTTRLLCGSGGHSCVKPRWILCCLTFTFIATSPALAEFKFSSSCPPRPPIPRLPPPPSANVPVLQFRRFHLPRSGDDVRHSLPAPAHTAHRLSLIPLQVCSGAASASANDSHYQGDAPPRSILPPFS